MRIIKSWQDVQLLRETAVLPEELITCLDNCLEELENSFEGGRPEGRESIYPFCLIVLIEVGDDAVNLQPVLTGYPAKGLMDAKYEQVKLLELGCGEYYHTFFLDDGQQMHIFTPAGIHGFHIESNLKRLAMQLPVARKESIE